MTSSGVVLASASRATPTSILQEDEADDLLRAIESELRKRRFGEPVRLGGRGRYAAPHSGDAARSALAPTTDCYEIDGMLATSDLWGLVDLDIPELHDPPFTPSIPLRLIGATDLFAVIREGDLVLHHPYQSFDPVVQFVHQAANDPHVLAIKQTLYRTSGDSPVVAALIEAAEKGKQVAVLIELKARFDEENNIHWARNLERVGAHVVYGFAGLKTHAQVDAWSCATNRTAFAATATSAPATTTTRPQKCTRT